MNRTENYDEHRSRPQRATVNETQAEGASATDRPVRRVKDIDHTSPVDGHTRSFERNTEERTARTDGGRRRENDDGAETPSTDEKRSRRQVKDIDHTSPVDGHVRAFHRGGESGGGAK